MNINQSAKAGLNTSPSLRSSLSDVPIDSRFTDEALSRLGDFSVSLSMISDTLYKGVSMYFGEEALYSLDLYRLSPSNDKVGDAPSAFIDRTRQSFLTIDHLLSDCRKLSDKLSNL